jgi:glycerol-3-phosphate dehydrogenase (NAD(P)+)
VTGTRVAVLGSGSWGTAFSLVLADAGNDVVLWARRAELADAIATKHQNLDYLPGIELPSTIAATTDAGAALAGAQIVVLAIPSQELRANLTRWRPELPRDCVLVSLMKGVELTTAKRMSEVIREVTGIPAERVAVITGPNLAWEIARRQPAASVVACVDEEVAGRIQSACHTPFFRPYTNTDVVGAELGGAVKNVIALAVGMAHGMGLGDNAKASLITRGLAETARLGVALGADAYTFSGLAGLGDLVATCQSPMSRNRTFGERLGAGVPLSELMAGSRQVAEGVKSCLAVRELARRNAVDMPIVEQVTGAVHEGLSPKEVLRSLMSRSAKPERHGL